VQVKIYNMNRHGPANSWQVRFDENILMLLRQPRTYFWILCFAVALIVLLLFIPRAKSNARQSLQFESFRKRPGTDRVGRNLFPNRLKRY
jgi:hypothetical protein